MGMEVERVKKVKRYKWKQTKKILEDKNTELGTRADREIENFHLSRRFVVFMGSNWRLWAKEEQKRVLLLME